MRNVILIFLLMTLAGGCITEYVPDFKENEELLVVEGLITDQPGPNIINIYKTLPIWTRDFRTELENCSVWIIDDLGVVTLLREEKNGTYVTDPATFRGMPGRKYTLHFTAKVNGEFHNYESLPMEMKPVPPIDSIYYEKRNYTYDHLPFEGCQIYLDTHDPSDSCRFYRWEYFETWEYRLPYDVENKICWASDISGEIMIKNASILNEGRIARYPLKLITNPVDRLTVKYSLLVNQFSLNEEEYIYWDRLQNTTEQVGGLFDIIPSTIPGNIFCVEDKLVKVLGYFSVSAMRSKRVFITDSFEGRNAIYDDCMKDTMRIFTSLPDTIPGMDMTFWVIYDYSDSVPPSAILTNRKYCGDCTVAGTNIKPDYWDDVK